MLHTHYSCSMDDDEEYDDDEDVVGEANHI